MGQTTFTGPIYSGDLQAGQTNGPNQAPVVLTQSVVLNNNGTLNTNQTIYIPAGSQIIDFNVDVLVVFNGGTSSSLNIGISSAGARNYAGPVDVKTASGRIPIAYNSTQLANMNQLSSTGAYQPNVAPLYVEVASVGTVPTSGRVVVTVRYAQLTSSN